MNKRTGILLVLCFWLFAASAKSDNGIKAVYGLIERVTPGYGSQFKLEMIKGEKNADVFEVDGNGRKIVLRGNTPVALATAYNWYLKYTCNAHVSWFGNQLNLPDRLPQPKNKERRKINGKYRVYMNYCTVSYTAAYWDWERWQREIDLMAMNGINMPLFTVGLDAIWYNTLLKYNFTDKEARAFLAGPGHAAWQWMQNIQSYGGPLPKSVIDGHLALGRQILCRELELGMHPIQQGFSGYVPREMKAKYPKANIKNKGGWCGFKGAAQLDPLDPLFEDFGMAFLKEEQRLFGTHGFYAADPFHEGRPPVDTPEYLGNVGTKIHELFQKFDPNGIWVMQSWSLREPIVKAVPKDKLLILDLKTHGASRESFWGYPFVVGTLHNFGGRINMHGDLRLVSSNLFKRAERINPAVCGSGMFPEAIEQNPVYYELAFEAPCHQDSIRLDKWLGDYTTRRYGVASPSAHKAWLMLLDGPYKKGTNGTERSSIVAARPALYPKKSGPNHGFKIPYNPTMLIRAQELLLKDMDKMSASKPYRFDIVDLQRQIMTNLGQVIHRQAADCFKNGDREGFKLHSGRFIEMLNDLDMMLRTRPEYSFDRWIYNARKWGKTPEEKDLMERDATSLVTIWGADGDPRIFDYSWREWSGLIKNFYCVRWQKFYDMLQKHLDEGTPYDEDNLKLQYGREAFRANDFYDSLGDWELDFVKRTNKARTPITEGDECEIVKSLYPKYLRLSKEYYNKKTVNQSGPKLKDTKTYENLGE